MKTRKILLVILALFLISCGNSQNASYNANGNDNTNMQTESAINANSNDNSMGDGMKYVTIETAKGKIKAELYTKDAPISTQNFIDLANSKFYDGLTFHRVEPGFVVQGGDPKGDGTGGSGKSIKLEINPKLTHIKGALGMARSNDPNSATSQFYIALEDIHGLDGSYAVFGKVVEGMDIVSQIRIGDKMNKVYITDK